MKNLRLVSWNVNGIRAVSRKGAFDWFIQESPDMFCIQETKANEDQLEESLTKIEGYSSYFVSAERKGYSGVALYSKVEPLNIHKGLGVPEFDLEGRTIIAEFPHFVLFNIYYPNGKASKDRLKYKMDFYETFLEKVNEFKAQGKNIVVCGDVNTAHKEIDLARPRENEKVSGFLPEEREWIDRFLGQGYADTFRLFNQDPENYTWWDYKTRARERNIGWRIDYFYVNEEFAQNVKAAHIFADVEGSDHCPIGIDLEIPE